MSEMLKRLDYYTKQSRSGVIYIPPRMNAELLELNHGIRYWFPILTKHLQLGGYSARSDLGWAWRGAGAMYDSILVETNINV